MGLKRAKAAAEATQKQPDVTIRQESSIVQFFPKTDAAKAWFKENVQSEGWQWLGDALCVDHGYGVQLAEGLRDAGFHLGHA